MSKANLQPRTMLISSTSERPASRAGAMEASANKSSRVLSVLCFVFARSVITAGPHSSTEAGLRLKSINWRGQRFPLETPFMRRKVPTGVASHIAVMCGSPCSGDELARASRSLGTDGDTPAHEVTTDWLRRPFVFCQVGFL